MARNQIAAIVTPPTPAVGVGAQILRPRRPAVEVLATLTRAAHDLSMKSRVHPKYKTKYRIGNWAEYDRALVRRGDITLWISADAVESWKPAPAGRRGGQRKYSDVAIETALVLRLVFRLPLRQTEGFLRSVLSLMGRGLEAPGPHDALATWPPSRRQASWSANGRRHASHR